MAGAACLRGGRWWTPPAALILLLVSANRLAAQEPAIQDSASEKDAKMLITPFAAPGYTPEQGGLLTVGALMSFRTRPLFKAKPHELIQRSTVTLNGSYSTTGAVTANVKLVSYWAADRLRIMADFVYKDMPDNYWGVGIQAGKAPEGDSTSAYQRGYLSFVPKALWRLNHAILLGPVLDLNGTDASAVSPGMAADPYYQQYGPTNQNSGIGVVGQYDTRDVGVNAWEGLYLNAQAISYGRFLGGQNTYQVYDLDYRQYHALGRPGKTLAWTARARWTNGDVPWAELPQVGGGSQLRGYREGRYRDKAMMYGIVEFRYQFTSATRETGLSRHGFVVWVGGGTVAPRFGEITEWLPNWGLGYRFEVQPRMNVRADLGYGREFLNSGNTFVPSVYFNFTEAF